MYAGLWKQQCGTTIRTMPEASSSVLVPLPNGLKRSPLPRYVRQILQLRRALFSRSQGLILRLPPKVSMRSLKHVALAIVAALITACGADTPTECCKDGQTSLRVVNGFTTAVDVLIDGNVALSGLAPGDIRTTAPLSGNHTLAFRAGGGTSSSSQTITTIAGAVTTVAAVRAQTGGVATTILDDTNSVVAAGKTKVRVLHLAPNAGTLQVYRTQPDYQTPVSWQFPFNYQSQPTSLSAPFYESTVGTWEVRVWETPADASGWAGASVRISVPLGSGEKATVVILDKPGGGVRVERL